MRIGNSFGHGEERPAVRRLIHISGLALLASFLLILLDDFNQEWKRLQARFGNIEENVYHSTAEVSFSFNPGIKQIVVDGLGRVDRCPTCHLGIDDSRYVKAEPPFQTHPGTILASHDIKQFGCTSCHLGQGYAVSYEQAAHTKLNFWNETMLPESLLQASCGTCHQSEVVPQAKIVTNGRLLIEDKGCTGCHEINSFYEEVKRGPDLDGIGNKVSKGWLYNFLKDPMAYLKKPRMPTFRLDEEQLLSLVEFLMSLDGKAFPPHKISELPSEVGDATRGKALIDESRCTTCHSIRGRGGKLAIDLGRVGDKVRENWLANFLRNVHYYQPDKKMLEYNFTESDALDMASYMLKEFSEGEFAVPSDTASAGDPKSHQGKQERIQEGERLFARYGCGGCHNLPGSRKLTKVGPKLNNIGNYLESKLDFGIHSDSLTSLYDWIFMKLKDPLAFDSASIMPEYFLTDKEALDVTVALLGNKENNYASQYIVHETERSLYKKPTGEFGELFERYSCISCHSIDKYGGTLSTVPLTIEGSKVQYAWLKQYLLEPYDIRPLVEEQMPQFRMTEKEAAVVADYIKRVYVSDEIPRYLEYDLTAADAESGRALVDEYECVECHTINGQGGEIGPNLDNVPVRLTAGWVYMWLLDPLKYKPETEHPDFEFTQDQAKQLTAYIMTAKARAR